MNPFDFLLFIRGWHFRNSQWAMYHKLVIINIISMQFLEAHRHQKPISRGKYCKSAKIVSLVIDFVGC